MWFLISGVIGDAAEALGVRNGEVNEDAIEVKEFENSSEVPADPARP